MSHSAMGTIIFLCSDKIKLVSMKIVSRQSYLTFQDLQVVTQHLIPIALWRDGFMKITQHTITTSNSFIFLFIFIIYYGDRLWRTLFAPVNSSFIPCIHRYPFSNFCQNLNNVVD